MTAPSSPSPPPADSSQTDMTELAGADQKPFEFGYGHGRMPLFMKVIWIGFLTFATWYLATNMLDALAIELG